ncbi:MAG: hypothetical protein AAB267_01825 [Candidatus Desantisbacteria bacterium]
MADGCNLYLSEKDFKQITDSLNNQKIGEIADSVKSVMEGFTKGMTEKVTYPLSNPNHPAHKVFSAYVLRNAVGNQSIPDTYKRELPKAVADIVKINPTVLGLVKPARNWGQTTSIDAPGKLGHKTRGAGFAYEILGTAALINKESKAKNTGVILKIHSTDRPDLGFKLQASYPFADKELPTQPKRGTTEADLFITRPTSIFDGGDKNIGVDFKHSMNSGEYSGPIRTSDIDGRKIALMTGEIHEFHYVTNGTFSKTVKETIDKANSEILDKKGKDFGLISYHEGVRYGNM